MKKLILNPRELLIMNSSSPSSDFSNGIGGTVLFCHLAKKRSIMINENDDGAKSAETVEYILRHNDPQILRANLLKLVNFYLIQSSDGPDRQDEVRHYYKCADNILAALGKTGALRVA